MSNNKKKMESKRKKFERRFEGSKWLEEGKGRDDVPNSDDGDAIVAEAKGRTKLAQLAAVGGPGRKKGLPRTAGKKPRKKGPTGATATMPRESITTLLYRGLAQQKGATETRALDDCDMVVSCVQYKSLTQPDIATIKRIVVRIKPVYERNGWEWGDTKWKEIFDPRMYYVLLRHRTTNEIVGVNIFMLDKEAGGIVAYCYECHVHPSLHGKGLGRVLMKSVMLLGSVAEVKIVMLTSFKDNPAMKFYQRLGYRIHPTSPSKCGEDVPYEILWAPVIHIQAQQSARDTVKATCEDEQEEEDKQEEEEREEVGEKEEEGEKVCMHPTRFFVCRHGESEANVAKVIVSGVDGITGYGLTENGRKQAESAGLLLQQLATNDDVADGTDDDRDGPSSSLESQRDRNVIRIVSSDFKRAKETADILAQIGNHKVQLDTRLRERYFGDFEQSGSENYQVVWDVDCVDPTHNKFGVESVTKVSERTRSVVVDVLKQHKPGDVVVFVAHGDTLQILQTCAEGHPLTTHRQRIHLENAVLREVDITNKEWLAQLLKT